MSLICKIFGHSWIWVWSEDHLAISAMCEICNKTIRNKAVWTKP